MKKQAKKKGMTQKRHAFLVRPGGFEPLAFRVGAERSIQLSYDRTYMTLRQTIVYHQQRIL